MLPKKKARKYDRKDRTGEDSIDTNLFLTQFKESKSVAIIPEEQKDRDRYRWHIESPKYGLMTKTIKLWTTVGLCGIHNKPIVGTKPSSNPYERCYDSDFECDYECNDEDCMSNCCYRDKIVESKNRTVVIFNRWTKYSKPN